MGHYKQNKFNYKNLLLTFLPSNILLLNQNSLKAF